MRLTVVLTGLPKDRFASTCPLKEIRLGRQRGKEPVDVRKVGAPTHKITFEVEVRPNPKTGKHDFYGPEVFGTAERRFLYVQWIGDDATGKPQMFRRLKVDLGAITARQAEHGASLVVQVTGVAKDGGPACATASMGPWQNA